MLFNLSFCVYVALSMCRMRELLSSYYGDLSDDDDDDEDEDNEPLEEPGVDGETGERGRGETSKKTSGYTKHSSSQQALNIDKSGFNPSAFLREQLSSKSLPELAAYDEKLAMDTKSLDANMQNLVYENYNKFIGATDTIREMRHSVGEIESEMEHLNTHMSALKEKNDKLNRKLGPNIEKTEQLVGVRRLLERLEFLFDLPVRLKRCIELNALSQAVRSYNVAADVLQRYSHVPSLHQIYVDASKTIEELKAHLRSQVEGSHDKKSISNVIESIQLLVQLHEPHDKLKELFLTWQRRHLLSVMDRFLSSYQENSLNSLQHTYGSDANLVSFDTDKELRNVMQGDIFSASLPFKFLFQDAYDFVRQFNYHFLDSLVEAVRKFKSLFGEGSSSDGDSQLTMTSVCQELLNNYLTRLKQHLSLPPVELCVVASEAENQGPSHHDIRTSKSSEEERDENGEQDAGNDDTFSDKDSQGDEDSGNLIPSYKALMRGLELLLNDIRRVSSNLPIKRLVDRGTELAETVLRHQLNIMFARCRAEIISHLTLYSNAEYVESVEEHAEDLETRDQSGQSSRAGSHSSSNPHVREKVGIALREKAFEKHSYVVEQIRYTLNNMAPLVRGGVHMIPDIAHAFVGMAQGQTEQILLWICSACEAFGDPFHPARAGSENLLTDLSESLEYDPGDASHYGKLVWEMRRRNVVYLPEWSEDVHEGSILLLSLVCKLLAERGVSCTLTNLQQGLPQGRELDSLLGNDSVDVQTTSSLNEKKTLIQRSYIGCAYLVSSFLQKHCDKASATLRHGVRTVDWSRIPEPRSCQLAIRLCIQEIVAARKLVAGISDQHLPAAPHGSSRRKASGMTDRKAMLGLSGGVGGELSKWVKKPRGNSFTGKFEEENTFDFEKNIERMLTSSSGTSQPIDVDLNKKLCERPHDLNLLTTLIVRHILMTFEMCLHGSLLSNYGIQQVQIDIAVLHVACTEYWQIAKEPMDILDKLFGDVLSQAVRRYYTEDETHIISPMAPNIVYSVASDVCKEILYA